MILGFSMPAVDSVAITGGTWLTADGGAAVADGRPGRVARLQWAGGAGIGSYVDITLTLATAAPLRVFGAIGLSVPPGVRCAFIGPGGAPFGGNTDDARTVRMPDGSTAAWAIGEDDMAPDASVTLRIYNDASGVPWANSSTVVDVGEIAAMRGFEIPIQPDWSRRLVTLTERSRTRGAQVSSVRGASYRRLAVAAQPGQRSVVRQGGGSGGMDWERVQAAILEPARVIAIPRWRDGDGGVDADEVAATTLYGITDDPGDIAHLGGDYYGWAFAIEEVPAR